MTLPTAHADSFARDRSPPAAQWPELLFELPALQALPERLNAAQWLLVDAVQRRGWGPRRCIVAADGTAWTYGQLLDQALRIAAVLQREMGLVSGQRVLLRAPNTPMLAAAWFGVLLAGGIAVGTMPLLRARELATLINKAQVTHALCDAALAAELATAAAEQPVLAQIRHFHTTADDGLEAAMARQPADPPTHPTAFDSLASDTALIAFTSGTTGQPKGTLHSHRDLIAACLCWPARVLRARPDDLFTGSPPLAFTFGLGGLLLFPLAIGAATLLLPQPAPALLLAAIAEHRATVLFTSPTAYRAMAAEAAARRIGAPQGGPLRQCVSAGEVLPAATRALWKQASGIEPIDGIGATEMLHIFISHDEAHARPGATGTVVPGYRACVLGEDGRPLPPGQVGRLAVKGPTGCRYLDDERQTQYVQGGWNLTGDAYWQDEDGYFHHQARTDDMIVSAGYNIAAPEVEEALLTHPAVAECAVIARPDDERGQVVAAFVVLRAGAAGTAGDDPAGRDALARELQAHAKQAIAPYKYPRAICFVPSLPRTETGKLQRFKLRSLDLPVHPRPGAAA
ncbi:MAG: AMP-binding protein [Burkholderiaceae bacterium]|nr:AMP-binding protein [Burkholderiaceae bacterium]